MWDVSKSGIVVEKNTSLITDIYVNEKLHWLFRFRLDRLQLSPSKIQYQYPPECNSRTSVDRCEPFSYARTR